MVKIGSISLGVDLQGVAEAKRKAQNFKDEVNDMGDQSMETSSRIDALQEKTGGFRNILGKLPALLSSFVGWLGITSISAVSLSTIMAGLTTATSAFGAALTYVIGLLSSVVSAIAAVVAGVSLSTVAIIAAILAVVAAVGLLITEILGITDVTPVTMKKVKELAATVRGWAQDLKQTIIGYVDAIVSYATGIGGTIKSTLNSIWNKIKSIVAGIINWIENKIDAVIGKIQDMVGWAQKVASDIGDTLSIDVLSDNSAQMETITQPDSNSGTTQKTEKKEVSVNGVNIKIDADKSWSDMSRREKRKLAEMVSEQAGDEFSKKS